MGGASSHKSGAFKVTVRDWLGSLVRVMVKVRFRVQKEIDFDP